MAQFPVRNVGTETKVLATLYGKSGLSAIADNPLLPYGMAKLFEIDANFRR